MATLPPPEAARILSATPEAFVAECRGSLRRAQDSVAVLKAMPETRGTERVLDLFDSAFATLADVSA